MPGDTSVISEHEPTKKSEIIQAEQNTAPLPQQTFEVKSEMTALRALSEVKGANGHAHGEGHVKLDVKTLAAYPSLLFKVLLQAVSAGNGEVVAQVFPYYERQSQTDPRLIQWSRALLASRERNFDESVRLYREIIAREPQNLAARLQLATALYQNYENEAALDQFDRVRAMPLPENVKVAVDMFIDAIHKRNQWRISGGVSYIRDNNVNNAPKSGTRLYGFRAWEPESARGLQYRLHVERRIPLQDGLYTKLILGTGGKQFFSNRKYSELSSTLGVALGMQTGRYDVSIGPFFERKWYAGGRDDSDALKRYSKTLGLGLEASYWLRPQWQWSAALQWGRECYDRYGYMDGNTLMLSNTLFYIRNAGQYWQLGVDYYRKGAHDPGQEYTLKSVRAGWNQDWPWGMSTALQISYGQRKYKGYRLFLAEKQKNHERAISLSLWHRGLHLAGFTPRLTYQYQAVRSNHAFYEFAKPRIFLELSRRF